MSPARPHAGRPNDAAGIPELERVLRQFDPIALAQMDGVALLNRIDIKYVLPAQRLARLLAALAPHYHILEIDGQRIGQYQSLYFDTPDFALYMCHHAGRRNRYKVRSRKYMSTELSFFEVKVKTSKERTVKNRIQTPVFVTRLTPETCDFVNAYCPASTCALEPKLWNVFSRITLVGNDTPERVTLDLDVQFRCNGYTAHLPNVVIAEVKQSGANRASAFIQQMHTLHLHPAGFSKYCIGVSMLYPEVKHNNFRPELRLIDRLMQGDSHVQRTH